MTDKFQSLLELHAATLLGLAALRALPAVAYVLASRRFSQRLKLATAAFALVLFAALHRFDPLAGDLIRYTPLVFGYFAAVVALTIGLRRAILSLGRANTLLIFATFFVLVPATFPFGYLRGFAILVGWEMMLASYSVCVDGYGDERRTSAADHAFFVLVNPVLVYAERGRDLARCVPPALLRSGAGILTIFAGRVVNSSIDRTSFDGAILPILSSCVLALVGAYLQHSGLASVQIGLLRFIGREVPERYRYPLFASSPLDFWRRWNTYVGSWARRYIFTPLALRLSRARRWKSVTVTCLAVLATFVAIGALHELAHLATTGESSVRWVAFFASQGVLVLAWEGVRRRSIGFTRGRDETVFVTYARRSVGWGTTVSSVVFSIALMTMAAKLH